MKSDVIKFCHDDCSYLHPNEHEQKENKKNHYCFKFFRNLVHGGYHPKILSYSKCRIIKQSIKQRISKYEFITMHNNNI